MSPEARSIWRDIGVAATAATLAVCCLLAFSGPSPVVPGEGAPSRLLKSSGSDLIHVFMCSDDTDMRGTFVAIKSTYTTASKPERLRFHLVTTPQFANAFRDLMGENLPNIPVEVHHDVAVQVRILAFIDYRASSRVKRQHASPYNIAPFYLQHFMRQSTSGKAKKVVFIKTDTLILGDICEVYDTDLKEYPVAAVKRCGEVWEDYIDFNELRIHGYDTFDPRSCVTSEALLVIDLPKWRKANITGKIEDWMQIHRGMRDDLWINSLSLPPLLLALNGNYHDLGKDWDCDGVGGEMLSNAESQVVRRSGFDRKAFRDLGLKHSLLGNVQPALVTCSANAKLLHYSGTSKPWMLDRLNRASPVCALPLLMPEKDWRSRKDAKVFCETAAFVNCSEIWNHFITETAACALKDFDKEWQEEEDKFISAQMEDEWRVEAAKKERERMKADERRKQMLPEENPIIKARREQFEGQRRKEEELDNDERERAARKENERIENQVGKNAVPLLLEDDGDSEG